ncbi:MAG: ATP-binding protein, partial [Chloroflexota bacterium]|nr:ATP-binding protein [Chloroflexota bacterium]
ALQNHLSNTAQLIETQASVYIGTPDETSQLKDYTNQIYEHLKIHVTFLDMNGVLLASSLPGEELPADPLNMPGVSTALSEGQAGVRFENNAIFAKIIRDTAGKNIGVLQLQKPIDSFSVNPAAIYERTIGVMLIGITAMVILSLIIKDRTLVPVDKLTVAAQEMSFGHFDDLAFPEKAGELDDLNQSLQDIALNLGEQIKILTNERGMLSAVLNQMTDGVIITDSEGRVKLLNPAAERIFQIDQSEGLERSIVEVLRYHQLVDLWRMANDGDRQSTMLEIGPKHLFLQVVGIPLKASLPGSTMLLIQDLTQLRHLETVRRDFISNISHELRTPLASMKALAETLQEGALDDPPAAKRFILRMQTEIDSLTQLVNELLELSRIESGKVPLSFHRIQPCQLLQPAFDRIALQAERAGLTLHLNCQPDLPAVFADPDRITQVLINLVHNAIKFTPPGGEISLNAYQDGEQIVFFVKDSGVGIARKDLGRIFERFYKADRARTGGGTGLGLSIARHMIESHGGYIWAESEDGVGSTFFFTLPIA